jgi:two-component system, chemotaxis family, chemotaxis protein CheY
MTKKTRAHVLLVEDDEDTREVLRLILEADGIEVAVARDGLDALTRIEELRALDPRTPSVIVLDYMMPRCSGPQFRQRQLANPLIADVPVILVSAVSDLSTRADLLKPFAMLQKPIDPDELTAIVREACDAYHRA